MRRADGYVCWVNPNVSRYKEGRVCWDSKYAAAFPDGIPCFFDRHEGARGYFAPLMSREVAERVVAVHNNTVDDGDPSSSWLMFDGADLHVAQCSNDPCGSYIIEATDGLYDLSDFPWDRLEFRNDADESAYELRLLGRSRGRRRALSTIAAAA